MRAAVPLALGRGLACAVHAAEEHEVETHGSWRGLGAATPPEAREVRADNKPVLKTSAYVLEWLPADGSKQPCLLAVSGGVAFE